ncbi:hypothetical protein ES288_D07G252000v1, partial [Gossypium darwinii]
KSKRHFPVKSSSLTSINFQFIISKAPDFSTDSLFQEVICFSYRLPFHFLPFKPFQSGFLGHLPPASRVSLVSSTSWLLLNMLMLLLHMERKRWSE